jgi:hypothetical protein
MMKSEEVGKKEVKRENWERGLGWGMRKGVRRQTESERDT